MIRLLCSLLLLFTFLSVDGQSFAQRLSKAAILLTEEEVHYDPSYYAMSYPKGDVPAGKGVCTDVIIRAFRQVDIDLQQKVHEDMRAHFKLYPNIWGLKRTDSNIDHRRVPNLMTYFKRQGYSISISMEATDYLPGDVVAWNLGGGTTHIGIVVDENSKDGQRPLIVHNIGAGQVMQDCLFDYRIIGHYRIKTPSN